MTDPTEAARLRRRLLAERQTLQEESAAHGGERGPQELDQARVGRLTRMDAMQVREMAAATERLRQQRLSRIASALERLEDGSFGECLGCGESIAPRRLALDPTVTLCIACAEVGEAG